MMELLGMRSAHASFEMELFLVLKLHLHSTELFIIELFWHFTVGKQNLY